MFEYWYSVCELCNWDKNKLRKDYKKSISELKDIFLENPLRLIESEQKILIFLYGEKYAYLINKYQNLLRRAYKNNVKLFPRTTGELVKVFNRLFDYFSIRDFISICQNLNWNTEAINDWIDELRNDNIVCSITNLKKKLLSHPNEIIKLDKDAFEFIFSPKKVEILVTYKPLIQKMIEANDEFTFDFATIINNLTIYFQVLIKKCNFDYKIFDVECKKIGLTRDKLNETLSLLRRDLKRLEPKKLNTENVPKTYLVLEDLLSIEDNDSIIKIIEESGVELHSLKSSIHDFLINYHYFEYDKLKLVLVNKVKYYYLYVNRKKQLQDKTKLEKEQLSLKNKLEIAIKYVNLFIESQCQTKAEFCLENNIQLKDFNFYVELIKKNDVDLYKLYFDKIQSIIAQKYTLLLKNMEIVTHLIKNGVNESEHIRPFDLLDYYQITHLSRAEFLNILKTKKNNLPTADVNLVLKFLRKYENSHILSQNDILSRINEKDIIGIEFDSNNNPIANTGRLVTSEEKISIINYLRENNIPLYDYCYELALKRYINGTLSISDNNKKSK